MVNVYEAQTQNKTKSVVIIGLFIVFISLAVYVLAQAFSNYLGYAPGGIGYVGLALIISGLMSLGGYYYSDKIILTISRARVADRKRDFKLYTVCENLSMAARLPKPKLYVIDDAAPNAFATGRDPKHAAICVTTGLIDKLSRTELEGVVGHELTHVKNYDTRLQSIVAVMVGMVALLGDWFLRSTWLGRRRDNDENNGVGAVIMVLGLIFAVLSPLIAQLIQLAISRRREFSADAGSVLITRQPGGLISALKNISEDGEVLKVANKATAHLYIVNPFKKQMGRATERFSGLFNTHPPIEKRIEALQQMA